MFFFRADGAGQRSAWCVELGGCSWSAGGCAGGPQGASLDSHRGGRDRARRVGWRGL